MKLPLVKVTNEEYKQVPDNPEYFVSNIGRVVLRRGDEEK